MVSRPMQGSVMTSQVTKSALPWTISSKLVSFRSLMGVQSLNAWWAKELSHELLEQKVNNVAMNSNKRLGSVGYEKGNMWKSASIAQPRAPLFPTKRFENPNKQKKRATNG
eukprot:3574924-Amphidinium_carterae.1